MARYVADSVGGIYPLLAPSVGALGAFLAGSNTVSNMMFSQFQFGVAQSLGISGAMIVAIQAVGAAAGNMVAIHNVVAASATVGLLGREGITLRKTVWPTLYYVLATGVLGIGAAVDIVKEERRQFAFRGGAVIRGGRDDHRVFSPNETR
jgi:lactate permease